MKKQEFADLLMFVISIIATIIVMASTGCTYNSAFVCGDKNVATMSPPKTVDLSSALQGNVPVNGGTVTDPSNTLNK